MIRSYEWQGVNRHVIRILHDDVEASVTLESEGRHNGAILLSMVDVERGEFASRMKRALAADVEAGLSEVLFMSRGWKGSAKFVLGREMVWVEVVNGDNVPTTVCLPRSVLVEGIRYTGVLS